MKSSSMLVVLLALVTLAPWPQLGQLQTATSVGYGIRVATARRLSEIAAGEQQQQQLVDSATAADSSSRDGSSVNSSSSSRGPDVPVIAPAAAADIAALNASSSSSSSSQLPAAVQESPVSIASLVATAARDRRPHRSRDSRNRASDDSSGSDSNSIDSRSINNRSASNGSRSYSNTNQATTNPTTNSRLISNNSKAPSTSNKTSNSRPASGSTTTSQPRSRPVKNVTAPASPSPTSSLTQPTDPETAQYNAVKAILPKLLVADGQTWELVDGLFANIPTKLSEWIPPGVPSATQDYSEFVPKHGQGYISLTAARIDGVVYITEVYAYAAGIDLSKLPDLVKALPQITSFTCSNCDRNQKNPATNILPADLPDSAPPTFKMISLGGCKIKGDLPESWGSWQTIEQIWIWDNLISGSIPESWANMANLKVFYAEENDLDGNLPQSWGQGSMQDHLAVYLHKNRKISGNIPISWGRFTGVLDISGTNITGCVPDELMHTIIMDTSPEACSINDPNREFTALKNIRGILRSTMNANALASWAESDGVSIAGAPPAYCTSWTGVKCDSNNKVTDLDLSYVAPDRPGVTIELSTMMQQIKRLSNLKVLNVSNLALTGLLADDRPLLDDMSNLAADLPNLQVLDLSNNPGLSGRLPKMWAGLTTLQMLDLSGTNVKTSLPDSWASLQSLRYFRAANTQIYGNLPETWGMLKNLLVLDLSNTKVTGRIPSAWADPLAMRMVAVAALESAKQDAAAAAAAAANMKISLSSYKEVPKPDLDENDMLYDGVIVPPGVTQAALSSPPRNRGAAASAGSSTVATAAAAAVPLAAADPLPVIASPEAVTNGSLTAAVKTYNSAQQSVTTASTIVAQLQQTLDSISGSASVSSFGLGMNSLQMLKLQNNALTGTLPAGFSSLSQMRVMDLSNNSLSGSLPMQWATMDYLQELNLGSNRLSGFLPDYWARLTNLRTLDLSNNTLSGELPITWIAMQNVEFIDLSRNRFTGRVPQEWEFMAGPNYRLQCLSVYGNTYMEYLRETQARFLDAGSRVKMAIKADEAGMCTGRNASAVPPAVVPLAGR